MMDWTLYKCLFNPLNTTLNPICHLLARLWAHHILHVSRIRVNQKIIEYVIQELFYLDLTFYLLKHLNKVQYIPELLQYTYSVIVFNFYMTWSIKRFYIRYAACVFLWFCKPLCLVLCPCHFSSWNNFLMHISWHFFWLGVYLVQCHLSCCPC